MDLLRHGLEYACIRTQKSTDLPSGVPNIFDFPLEYGLENVVIITFKIQIITLRGFFLSLKKRGRIFLPAFELQ